MEPILKCFKPLYIDRSVRPCYPRGTTLCAKSHTQRQRVFTRVLTSKQTSQQSVAKQQLIKAMKQRLRQLGKIREEDIEEQFEIRRKQIQESVNLRKIRILAIECFILEAKKKAYMKYRHVCSKPHCKGCDKISEVVENIIRLDLWNESEEFKKKMETLHAELIIEKKQGEESSQLQRRMNLWASLPKQMKKNSHNLPEMKTVSKIDQYQSQPVSPSSHKLIAPQPKESVISALQKVQRELSQDIQEEPSSDSVRDEPKPTNTAIIEKQQAQKPRIARRAQRKSNNSKQRKKVLVEDCLQQSTFHREKKHKVKRDLTFKEKAEKQPFASEQNNLHEEALSTLKNKNNELLLKQLEMTSKKKNYFQAPSQNSEHLAMVGSDKQLGESEEETGLTNYMLEKIFYKFIKIHLIGGEEEEETVFELPESQKVKPRSGKTSMISILRRKQLKGLLNLREIKKGLKSQIEKEANLKKQKAFTDGQFRLISETMTLTELKEFISRRFTADNISNTSMKDLQEFYRYVQYDLFTSKERQKQLMEEHSIQAVVENEQIQLFIKQINIQQPNLKSLQFADFDEDEIEQTHFSRQLRSSVTNAFNKNSVDRIMFSEKPFVRFSGDLQQMQMGTIQVI